MFPDTLITSAHTLYTHKYTHTQTLSQRRLYHINTHTLSPWREHINSTHNTGWGTWGKRSCLSLNTRCRTCCSLGCHAPIVILSHWLSAHWNVRHWRQNLFPAGLTDWVKFGAMNHHSTKLCMTVISMGTFDLEAEIYSKGLYTDEVYNDGSLPVSHPSVNVCEHFTSAGPGTTREPIVVLKDSRLTDIIPIRCNPHAPFPPLIMLPSKKRKHTLMGSHFSHLAVYVSIHADSFRFTWQGFEISVRSGYA